MNYGIRQYKKRQPWYEDKNVLVALTLLALVMGFVGCESPKMSKAFMQQTEVSR